MPKKLKRANRTGSVYFDKSKKRWIAQITLGFNQEGKQDFFKRSYKTKTEADNALARLRTQHEIGEVVPPSNLTVRELLEDWLTWKAMRDLRETTKASYSSVIRLYLVPALGSKRVQALTTSDIERAYETMREPRADHRGNGKTYVPSREQIVLVHRVLKQALKEWGVGRGIIKKNPADKVKIPKYKAKRGEVGGGRAKYEPYSESELRRFLEATFEHHLFIAFFLAGAMGLREAEIAGLRWKDVAIDAEQLNPEGEGQLWVRVQRTRVGGKIIEGSPKSERSNRPLPLSAKAVATLRVHREQQQDWAREYGWPWSNDGFVIAKPEDGTPLRPDSIWKRFRSLTNRLGLRPVAFHDLRHGFVSIMAAKRVPLEVISKLVGHHSATFTAEAYRHIFAAEGLTAAKAMDSVSPDVGIRTLTLNSASEITKDEPEPTPGLMRRKLTTYQAQRIKTRIKAGERPEDVAADYGISSRMARYIANGERYGRLESDASVSNKKLAIRNKVSRAN